MQRISNILILFLKIFSEPKRRNKKAIFSKNPQNSITHLHAVLMSTKRLKQIGKVECTNLQSQANKKTAISLTP